MSRPKRSSLPEAPLSRREQLFVSAYLAHGCVAARGAEALATKPLTAQGYANLGHAYITRPNVRAAVEAALAEMRERREWTAAHVLESIRAVSDSDVGNYYWPDGRLKPLTALTPPQRRAIRSIRVLRQNITTGDGVTEQLIELRLFDKNVANEQAMRVFGIGQGAGLPVADVPCFALPADGPQIIAVH